MNWRPDPKGPPANSRNGVSIFASAPSCGSSTMPGAEQHDPGPARPAPPGLPAPTPPPARARKSLPGRRILGERLAAPVAVEPDGRGADERGRRLFGLGDEARERPRGEERGCRGAAPCGRRSTGRSPIDSPARLTMTSAPAQGEAQGPSPCRRAVQAMCSNCAAASRRAGGGRGRLVRIWMRWPAAAREAARARPRKPEPPAMTMRMGEGYRRQKPEDRSRDRTEAGGERQESEREAGEAAWREAAGR